MVAISIIILFLEFIRHVIVHQLQHVKSDISPLFR
jgi:hypothetical protein